MNFRQSTTSSYLLMSLLQIVFVSSKSSNLSSFSMPFHGLREIEVLIIKYPNVCQAYKILYKKGHNLFLTFTLDQATSVWCQLPAGSDRCRSQRWVGSLMLLVVVGMWSCCLFLWKGVGKGELSSHSPFHQAVALSSRLFFWEQWGKVCRWPACQSSCVNFTCVGA